MNICERDEMTKLQHYLLAAPKPTGIGRKAEARRASLNRAAAQFCHLARAWQRVKPPRRVA